MKQPTLASTIALLVLMVIPITRVSAHHSFAMFDRTRQVPLEGVVKDFQFTNPHAWIYLLVAPADGGEAVEWTIEALSPNVLGRQGWKRNTLKPGDHVKVLINPMRDGTSAGNLITVTLADGTTLGGGA